MDLEALKVELAKPEYQSLSDQQAADLLNLKNISALKPGTWATELTVLAVLGPTAGEAFLSALEAVANANDLVARAVRWLRSSTGIDLGNEFVQAQLTALAQANAVDSASAGTLIAYGTTMISRAEQLGLGEIGIGAVYNARLQMGVN